jgi:hypothetical protein
VWELGVPVTDAVLLQGALRIIKVLACADSKAVNMFVSASVYHPWHAHYQLSKQGLFSRYTSRRRRLCRQASPCSAVHVP